MSVIDILTPIFFFFLLDLTENSLYLSHTQDGSNIEFYDCFILHELPYCRRLRYPIVLSRTHTAFSCDGRKAGIKHRFSDLKLHNTTISTILHQWKSSLEQVEAFVRYSHDNEQSDQDLCQCQGETVFGKYCEYELPFGTTFEQTAAWQLNMRNTDEWKVQMHGNITCYEGIKCDSGLLCLDWREICDGTQNCMFGLDEENCDILELNICEDDEYRCSNGMCIPDEYFVDGNRDCLDWTDEMGDGKGNLCPWQSVSIECDDHLCLRNRWSCGDGQCASVQRYFQSTIDWSACDNRRDQYFMCETYNRAPMWTMPNGRCTGDRQYSAYLPMNVKEEEKCEYLLKCAISRGAANGCPCKRGSVECMNILHQNCSLSIIPYPKGAIVAPFLFHYFEMTPLNMDVYQSRLLINGTVKCQHTLVHKTMLTKTNSAMNNRYIIYTIFCNDTVSPKEFESNDSLNQCFRTNESTNICKEWNPCLSVTRIKDGWEDCLNVQDETDQEKQVIDKTCSRVQHHRFRCSFDQPTCLSVRALGVFLPFCRNGHDRYSRDDGRSLSNMKCSSTANDDCHFVRRHITQSWSDMDNNDTNMNVRVSFRSYCDTFWDLKSAEDENLNECAQYWKCRQSQFRCNTGQCIARNWRDDYEQEWDCADASDEHSFLASVTREVLKQTSTNSSYDGVTWTSETCSSTSALICLSPNSTHRQLKCVNFNQIGDSKIDCLGAIDERNTFRHCSSSSETLGHHFLCASTNTCIPFFLHCRENHRCPNRTDDDQWCSRSVPALNCDESTDFVCFDGSCVKGWRCDRELDCPYGEDEYLCDFSSMLVEKLIPYRRTKQSEASIAKQFVDLLLLSADLNITVLTASVITADPILSNNLSNQSSSSAALLTPYVCNRGIGILSSNHSIVCFCPPQYYGSYCEYHADRLSLLLHLNLSQSNYTHQTDPSIVIKLLVLFLFHDADDDQILMSHEFHVRPRLEMPTIKKKKVTFPYPRSPRFRQHRQDRYRNRSDIIHSHPYAIRIEAYEMYVTMRSSVMAVWQYPIQFDYLPVFRFAKVLHLTDMDRWNPNPCSSQPCPPNSQCHRLMNDRAGFVCLCKPGYTGKNCVMRDQQCLTGHCAANSLCLPNYRSVLRGNNDPYCVCPLNRYGDRCAIINDICQVNNPCLNGGSCQSASGPDTVFCLCPIEYRGEHCEIEKARVRLSIMNRIASQGVTIQDFQIDYVSLKLILTYGEVYNYLPHSITHVYDATIVPEIIIAMLYHSYDQWSPVLYLLSVTQNARFVDGTTAMSDRNHCKHIRTFSNVTSPIRYHHECIKNEELICFHDDHYLCICEPNHTHVECFLYDDQLDRCSNCWSGGRCLRGYHQRSNDFLCLCPPCYSGRQCQFSWKSFAFTLDQLLYADLTSSAKNIRSALIIIFSVLGFLLAIPNNLSSFVTLRKPPCLRTGVGHYLLCLSVINQVNLGFFLVRLIHLINSMIGGRTPSMADEILCRSSNYLLTSSGRLVYWLSSLIAIERVYMTVVLNGKLLGKPSIAHRLILFAIMIVLISHCYELIFYKTFHDPDDPQRSFCVIEFPRHSRSLWSAVHLVNMIVHSLVPFFINLCSTITISVIMVKNKMNTQRKHTTTESGWITFCRHSRLALDVLRENKDLVVGPSITLIPLSFSLPLVVAGFALNCENLENSSIRYFLIVSYCATLTPQCTSFLLYIRPSSLYMGEWRKTKIGRWIQTR